MPGTVFAGTNFNPEEDAKILRTALKGISNNDNAVIDIVTKRTNEQRQQIRIHYKLLYGKDITTEFRSKLKMNFNRIVIALFTKPRIFDVDCLTDAIHGPGTNETTLIELLVSRTNEEIQEINKIYSTLNKKTLQRDIEEDTSGYFKRLLVSLTTGKRETSKHSNTSKAQEDAKRLYEAGEKRIGTDEETFIMIMGSQSFPQLKEISAQYSKMFDKHIRTSIKSEFSGDIKDGLLAIVDFAEDPKKFFARGLYKSMKGLGTDDKALIRIIATRSEIDLSDIKRIFYEKYDKSLESFIKGDTSGSYQKILLALIGER